MNTRIQIADRIIGIDYPPFVMAEMSANHNGSIEAAKRIIDEAAKAGADALKLQTYRPDTITIQSDRTDFQINGGLWEGRTLYDLYEWAHTPWKWHRQLFDYARERGIIVFSSPFDNTAIDLLEDLNAPAYKIASFEAIDHALIRYAAGTGKPLIISTGMADAEEIEEAIQVARDGGCKELAILHCVSGYPAPASDYNLLTILDMIDRFGLVTGLSDHTLNNTTAVSSVALGASIIEKHFTLDRSRGGPDDSFSLEPKEFGELCRDTAIAWEALGSVDYGRKSSEIGNVQFRRSLYFVEDLKAGTIIEAHHIRSVRPGYGIAPKHFDEILGRRLKVDVSYATPVSWESFASA